MHAIYAGWSPAGYREESISDANQFAVPSGETAWLDLADPELGTLEHLQRRFDFHPLAVEDASKPHQRPKIDPYGAYDFIVFYTLRYDAAARSLEKREIDLFVGGSYVVSVHRGAVPELDQARERWKEGAGGGAGATLGFLVHAVLDTIVDEYFAAVDAIAEEIDAMEEQLFSSSHKHLLRRVLAARANLLEARRIAGAERDVLNVLLRGNSFLEPEVTPYFMDVHDHLIRVTDALDLHRDILASLMDGYLSVVSNNLNETMKVIAAGGLILVAATLVTGIYGMNFEHLPGKEWVYGFPATIAGMAAIAVALYLVFRKRGWF